MDITNLTTERAFRLVLAMSAEKLSELKESESLADDEYILLQESLEIMKDYGIEEFGIGDDFLSGSDEVRSTTDEMFDISVENEAESLRDGTIEEHEPEPPAQETAPQAPKKSERKFYRTGEIRIPGAEDYWVGPLTGTALRGICSEPREIIHWNQCPIRQPLAFDTWEDYYEARDKAGLSKLYKAGETKAETTVEVKTEPITVDATASNNEEHTKPPLGFQTWAEYYAARRKEAQATTPALPYFSQGSFPYHTGM